MRTIITVRAQKATPEQLAAMNHRTLRAAAELHYHILRSLDAQADAELRQIIAARRIGARRLAHIIRLRDEAQAVALTYLHEICRRARIAKGFADHQDDDEMVAAYNREARETTKYLQTRARKIETAPKRVQKEFKIQ